MMTNQTDLERLGMIALGLHWRTLATDGRITTSVANPPFTEWGGYCAVRRYELSGASDAYVGVVIDGNHVSECHFETLLDALEFCRHPFRVIAPGDYWHGTEIQARS